MYSNPTDYTVTYPRLLREKKKKTKRINKPKSEKPPEPLLS
jgi:hypothetical protein